MAQGGQATAMRSVEGALFYIVPAGAKPVTRIAEEGKGPTRREGRYDRHSVLIRDGRAISGELTLDRQGFVLLHRDTAVSDFYDRDEVTSVYYPEVERLVKDATGAAKVIAFDHNLRASDDSIRGAHGVREPVKVVHNDYTPRSGPQRVRDVIGGDEAEALLAHRFAVINVWRPIRGPVKCAPLAVCDAQSIAPGDLVATDLVYRDRTGEVYQARFNPDHRWYYFPEMRRDEAMLIKCYDSATDGRARFTAHTSFDDPTAPADAPPRESIEARTLAFFAPE